MVHKSTEQFRTNLHRSKEITSQQQNVISKKIEKQEEGNQYQTKFYTPDIKAKDQKELIVQFFVSAFSLKKIIASLCGAGALFVLFVVGKNVKNIISNLNFIRTNLFFNHLLNFSEVFLFCFVITAVNIILIRLENISMQGLLPSLGAAVQVSIQPIAISFLVCAGIVIAINGTVVLFGCIPIVGPILYSILLLPLYLISIAIIILALVVFWFYPPILAYSKSFKESMLTLRKLFIQHHFFLVLYSVALAISALIFLGIVMMMNNVVVSIAFFCIKMIAEKDFATMISALPFNIVPQFSVNGFFIQMMILYNFVGNLFFSYRISGIVFGCIFLFVTLVTYGVAISSIGDLSNVAYRAIVTNQQSMEKMVTRFFIALSFVLIVLYLVKNIF
ncbi:MAG: hypothetical protein N2316_08660 [Spirochaetes bacterium]|nr:hypothetical protein [Spirochaetota bacterium]